MNAPLDKLTVKGFKSIRSLEDFELRNINVLIGANGAGKSNFVDFFRMLSAMMKQGGLKEFAAGQADSFFFGGPRLTDKIEVSMRFGGNGYDFELKPTEDGFFLISNERRHILPIDYSRDIGTVGFDPSLLVEKQKEEDLGLQNSSWYTYQSITSWKIYHFHDTGKMAGARRFSDVNHCDSLTSDASNLAAFLLHLKKKHLECYRQIVETIQIIIPFLDDFILEPTENETVRLMWRQKGLNDFPMRPTQLSDGSLRFICLATALLQPKPPSTVIIDEPELGLHPEAVRILAELMQNESRRMQIIVATQSPLFLDQFGVEDVIVVNRKEGQSTFERLNEEDFTVWLEALYFSDPTVLASKLGVPKSQIDAIISECGEPEKINDHFDTKPSKRLENLYPAFKKTTTGIAIAQEVGLPSMRKACPIFNEWMSRLEALTFGEGIRHFHSKPLW